MLRIRGELNWKRGLGEFLLIVTGILVALAVDDLRESRQDRELEAFYLAALEADLVRDSLDLDRSIPAAGDRVLAASQLLRALGRSELFATPAAPVAVDSLTHGEALETLAFQRRFDLADGAYGDLLSTGRLEVLRDLNLREAISLYYWESDRVVRDDQRYEAATAAYIRSVTAAGVAPSAAPLLADPLRGLRSRPAVMAEIVNVRSASQAQGAQHIRAAARTRALLQQIRNR